MRFARALVIALAVAFGATLTSAPVDAPARTQALDVQTVVGGLRTIWAVDFAPDGRIFLTERPGRIRVIRAGLLDPVPWATVEVVESGESGLLGLALDPNFEENGYVYVAYTYRTDGAMQNRLVRMREEETTGRGVFDAILLDDVRGAGVHDGGRVKFGPDGKLYWTMGETGQTQLAQSLDSWNGKILRVNPDGSVPDDNPFPGSPVYSYGHRNPQGLAWQPGTGRLYATEHGPSGADSCCDEVNYILPGQNYGWPQAFGEGTAPDTVPPVIESGADTWAPGGATFIPEGPWAGSLVFVGLRGESLYRLMLEEGNPTTVLGFERLLQGQYGRLRDAVVGPDGMLYVSTSNRDGRGSPGADDDRLLRITVS